MTRVSPAGLISRHCWLEHNMKLCRRRDADASTHEKWMPNDGRNAKLQSQRRDTQRFLLIIHFDDFSTHEQLLSHGAVLAALLALPARQYAKEAQHE